MPVYDRQIAYINLIENGEKKKNAGFLKWESDGSKHKVEINIRGLYQTDTTTVEMKTKDGKLFDHMRIEDGKGLYKKECNGLTVGLDQIPVSDFDNVIFSLPGNRKLVATWINMNKREKLISKVIKEEHIEEHIEEVHSDQEPVSKNIIEEEIVSEEVISAEKKDIDKIDTKLNNKTEKIYETRWERLCDMFETIHPYDDDREYLKITPNDFYILRESYQHLGHNSFLLHGFYNYHYLILGRKNKDLNDTYLLGVPGVYYEREIMVARMFGFEGFECSKPDLETGSFGYYCITVE